MDTVVYFILFTMLIILMNENKDFSLELVIPVYGDPIGSTIKTLQLKPLIVESMTIKTFTITKQVLTPTSKNHALGTGFCADFSIRKPNSDVSRDVAGQQQFQYEFVPSRNSINQEDNVANPSASLTPF
ncbi:31357_t:CDS:2 [Gigaspora margarita]|uniref:31357_t:CDS:1 n=1 Tax=Gigaspora margarita TaxID=4874 RepID=A0ABN7UWC2_GIGMA|nr:31357_t:CDS:2 [Gigaspora margarita]